jgi:hypothetical protein
MKWGNKMNFDINKFSFYTCGITYGIYEEEQVTKEDFCKAINKWLFEETGDYGYYTGCARCGEVCLDFNSYSREGFIEVNCLVTDNREEFTDSSLTRYIGLYTVSIEKTEIPINQYNEEMLYNMINHILECAEEKKKEFIWFQDGETVEDKLNKELSVF